MNKIFAFILLFCAVSSFAETAQACLSAGASPAKIMKVIEDAEYIGKVKVLELKKTGEGYNTKWETVILPIQSYKGRLMKPIKIKDVCCNSCSKSFLPEGTIYEEIIFKRERKYSLSMQWDLLPESVWTNLREKAKPSQLLFQEEKKCIDQGGLLITHGGISWVNVVDCHFKSTDFGKECSNFEDCDGLCLADHSSTEGFQPLFVYEFTPGPERPELPGRCSPWRDMDGCYSEVKDGKILNQVCKD